MGWKLNGHMIHQYQVTVCHASQHSMPMPVNKKHIFNVCVEYFVDNFKGHPIHSIQHILSIHRKTWFAPCYHVEILRAARAVLAPMIISIALAVAKAPVMALFMSCHYNFAVTAAASGPGTTNMFQNYFSYLYNDFYAVLSPPQGCCRPGCVAVTHSGS